MSENLTMPAVAKSSGGAGTWTRVWAAGVILAIVLAICLVIGFVGMKVVGVVMGPSRAISSLANLAAGIAADSVKPKITVREFVLSSIDDLTKKKKLVVCEAVVSTDVMREEGSSSWGMYWGTNVARVAVRDARVQYVVDLGTQGTSDYVFDPEAKTLTVSVPRPQVDTQMVAIDPTKIETLDLRGGWARWDKGDTRDHAIAELKPKIITEANKQLARHRADELGVESVSELLKPAASALGGDVVVKVVYREPQ